jgi:hypothetical protein
MADYQQFADAVRGAANEGAPTSSIPEVARAMASAFNAAAVSTAGRGASVTAEQNAADEERRRKEAEAARIQSLKDKVDPSKFRKEIAKDGGFNFFDPTGKAIDINQYAAQTGQRKVDILRDSENPVDQQFLFDYQKLNDVNQAVWNNDSAEIAALKQQYPDVLSGSTKPDDLNMRLLQKYPHLYGKGTYGQSLSNLGRPLFRSTDGFSSGVTSGSSAGAGGWTPS